MWATEATLKLQTLVHTLAAGCWSAPAPHEWEFVGIYIEAYLKLH